MLNNFIANNMEKKELVVRDLIKKLLDFNPDAKVTINLTGVPFPLYFNFSLCWGNDNEGDSCASRSAFVHRRSCILWTYVHRCQGRTCIASQDVRA